MVAGRPAPQHRGKGPELWRAGAGGQEQAGAATQVTTPEVAYSRVPLSIAYQPLPPHLMSTYALLTSPSSTASVATIAPPAAIAAISYTPAVPTKCTSSYACHPVLPWPFRSAQQGF